MTDVFSLKNTDEKFSEKLNLDELYERKRQADLKELNVYNRLLHRIHVRIKTASRSRINNTYCWYMIPEVIIGIPRYEQSSAIAYLMHKLTENGLQVKFVQPNILFISWHNWIPKYVRTEIKKNTGRVIDGYGNNIEHTTPEIDNNNMERLVDKRGKKKTDDKKFKSIQNYKPTGNFTYNLKMMKDLSSKLSGI